MTHKYSVLHESGTLDSTRSIAWRVNRLWRIAATGISFSIFGIGGVLLPFIAVPILFLLPGGRRARERRAKATIHYTFRGFVEIMRGLGVLTYSVEDREKLNRPGQLILANHPSLVDVVFLIAFIKQADCVVKSSLLRNPFMRGPICHIAGYIANDDPEAVVEQAAASLDRGNSLIIFPEGTRSTPGKPLSMQRGAANVALHAGVPITPVVITCVPSTLTKNLPWYRVPERRFHVAMGPRANIDTAPWRAEARRSIAARRLTHFLERYFSQELKSQELKQQELAHITRGQSIMGQEFTLDD